LSRKATLDLAAGQGAPTADTRGCSDRRNSASLPSVNLSEVVEQLEALDEDATIYAAKPWSPGSRAVVVAVEPDVDEAPPEAAGLDYFLEVYLALEAATVSEAATRIDRVIFYATNDAFLFDG
jgi:hypothetical protein